MLLLFKRTPAIGPSSETVRPEFGSRLLEPKIEPEEVFTPVSL
jgi:hypothetical protein